VLVGWGLHALLGAVLFGLTSNIWLWIALQFMNMLVTPLINGSNQALWQSKVAPELQGRVFSARRLIAWLSNPITPIVTGLMADRWLEPGLRDGESALSAVFGGMFGVGPGAGMALATVASGVLIVAVAVIAYIFKPVRHADTIQV
jgi:hypothetical protein